MVFSTIIFLFRFLPITLALYYLAPAKLKNTVLFLCSLVFYCWGEVRFFPVMVALILINYISGLCIEHFDQKPALRRTFLLIALIGSLGMLFYFKYANFVLRSANALLGTAFAEIQGIGTLPLGISFYTFQTLSYSIDVYRRDVKAERNIIDFGAYVVMFPQLIAGPIVKYRDVSNQLHVYRHRYSLQQIEEGMTLFTFGLAKKVLLADAIGALWTDIIGVADSPSTTFVGLANASTPLVWLGIIAYSLQLYFDFSGYSMMGIGMGKMLGFDFPQNFNYPYISASITEFWRRWHMTLSGWFREYVYIPLGGNRKGLKRQIMNLFIVELLTGIWHGANWNFICWGLYYFVLLAIEKLFLLQYLLDVFCDTITKTMLHCLVGRKSHYLPTIRYPFNVYSFIYHCFCNMRIAFPTNLHFSINRHCIFTMRLGCSPNHRTHIRLIFIRHRFARSTIYNSRSANICTFTHIDSVTCNSYQCSC